MLTKATYHPSYKTYELTNHLGNVMSKISDRNVPVDDVNNNILYFLPDVDTYQDYFPFGMVMSERSGSEMSAEYRYEFYDWASNNLPESHYYLKGGAISKEPKALNSTASPEYSFRQFQADLQYPLILGSESKQ